MRIISELSGKISNNILLRYYNLFKGSVEQCEEASHKCITSIFKEYLCNIGFCVFFFNLYDELYQNIKFQDVLRKYKTIYSSNNVRKFFELSKQNFEMLILSYI